MNELDLIREIEKRPILYDKSMSGFNKTRLRDDAWRDVRDSLNVPGRPHASEAECKKRWRSLRDSFIKLQRTHGGRTRWSYHQAMRFLLPHVEPKSEATAKQDTEESSDGEDDVPLRQTNSPADLNNSATNSTSRYDEDDDSQPSPKKPRLQSTDEDNACHCNRTDPDELFLLSCSTALKRLNSKQNAVARLKIQQVLYEAEFGSQMEMPFVTPASDCGYGAPFDDSDE